ncbi:MAG: transcription-repair coupling factor, partial [Moraxellaceae bacterium]
MSKTALVVAPSIPKKTGDKLTWGNAQGSGRAWAIAEAACAQGNSGLVICNNMADAYRLEHELSLFLKDRPNAPKLSHFADWETLAYDNFSPHQDIISTRMRSLYELAKGERVLVVASVGTLLQ